MEARNHQPISAYTSEGLKAVSLPGVEMRSQLLTEGMPVDLNCGRYCVEAAIKYWLVQLSRRLKPNAGDVFHGLLPESSMKILGIKLAWDASAEGSRYTRAVGKPTSLEQWARQLQNDGPLIVDGALGSVLGITHVRHYILIVGADIRSGVLLCRDPLAAGKGEIEYKFDWVQPRIDNVYAIDLGALREDTDPAPAFPSAASAAAPPGGTH